MKEKARANERRVGASRVNGGGEVGGGIVIYSGIGRRCCVSKVM